MKVFAVDVSGSMPAQTRDVVATQIVTLLSDPAETYMLLTFDMSVHGVWLTRGAPSIDNLKAGYGGTNVECVFHYLREQGITPESLTIFTDGQFPTNEIRVAFPTTYVIV